MANSTKGRRNRSFQFPDEVLDTAIEAVCFPSDLIHCIGRLDLLHIPQFHNLDVSMQVTDQMIKLHHPRSTTGEQFGDATEMRIASACLDVVANVKVHTSLRSFRRGCRPNPEKRL